MYMLMVASQASRLHRPVVLSARRRLACGSEPVAHRWNRPDGVEAIPKMVESVPLRPGPLRLTPSSVSESQHRWSTSARNLAEIARRSGEPAPALAERGPSSVDYPAQHLVDIADSTGCVGLGGRGSKASERAGIEWIGMTMKKERYVMSTPL